MSIASELVRIRAAKAALRSAINAKGGNLTAAQRIDDYADAVTALQMSADFYKCASVDTVNKTWTGYKAVLSDGVYSFESAVTTGLTYTSVTPVVNKVYSADALITGTLYEGITVDGLLLYASLSGDMAACETEQTITKSGNVAFETFQGVPCAKFQGNGYLDFSPAVSHLTGNNPFTITWWQKYDSNMGTGYMWQFGTGVDDRIVGGGHWVYYNGGYIGGATPINDLHFCCLTYNGSALSYYMGGAPNGSTSSSAPNTSNSLRLGRGSGEYFGGYLAAFRIYNRVLTSSEIAALASEFTPSNS